MITASASEREIDRKVLLGRQPIFDRNLCVRGYELLFRTTSAGEPFDGNAATVEVIVNAFTEFGIEAVVGDHPAFINSTREFLLGGGPELLPRDAVVLEVLEDITIDDEVVSRVEALVASGFTIALDDYVADPRWDPLLPLVHIVKVDIPQLCEAELRRHLRDLRPYAITVLAEKVETEAEFEMLCDMGFDLFQGFFLARPRILGRPRVPSSRLNLLRLVARLQNADNGSEELVAMIEQDVSLSFKLLRYVNSASLGMPLSISSVRQAVVYLGFDELRRWALLLAMSGLDDRPLELCRIALARGRMCERLAVAGRRHDPGAYFTVGMFSTLSSILQTPLSMILGDLSLAADMEAALLHRTGPIADALDATLRSECGDVSRVRCWNLSPREVNAIFLESVVWADAHFRLM